MAQLRLIWSSDAANTCRTEADGQVVGIIVGVNSFTNVSDDLERDLVEVLRKHSNNAGGKA